MRSIRALAAGHRGGSTEGTLGFLFFIVALAIIGVGVRIVLIASSNSTLSTLTYSEFAHKMPKSGWYRVTGTVLDVAHSVYWEENDVPINVYAPVRPLTGKDTAPDEIYVELTDSKTLSGFLDMNYARRKGGDAAAQRFAQAHRDVFLQKRDISGLVTFGHRDPMGEWAKVGLDAANVTFIEDGWKPNQGLGYAGCVTGLVLALICIGLMRRK